MLSEEQVRVWLETSLRREPAVLRDASLYADEHALERQEIFRSQVALIRVLVGAMEARTVLELGTFLGYSTGAFLDALGDVEGVSVVTVDWDSDLVGFASRNLDAHGYAGHVEFVVDDAHSACDRFIGSGRLFDIVFLDVDEREYPSLYDRCVRLLRVGGLLVVDNILMPTVEGWDTAKNVVTGDDEVIEALRATLSMALVDERVDSAVVPLGSGMLLGYKRGE